MKFTNRHGLPDQVVRWLTSDQYDYQPNTFSATKILAPIRQTVLMRLHADILEMDVSDLIASRYGTAIHDSFEKVTMPGVVKEQRFYHELGGFKISGRFDMIVNKDNPTQKLMDIKSTSVWTFIYGSRDLDYIRQLSIYKYLANKNGFNIEPTAQVIYIFTDWKKSDAQKNPDYPQIRIVIKDIVLMLDEETETYISSRVTEIARLLKDPTLPLPDCTDEDLWKKGDKFAVMKEGRKTAIKVFDDLEPAELMAQTDPNYSVEHRKGTANRCAYCAAWKVCGQFKDLKEKGLVAEPME